jgi:hypothetical protein
MTTVPPLESMLALPLDQIEIVIGEALLAGELGSKDASDEQKRSVAQRWFARNLDTLRTLVCDSGALKKTAAGSHNKDRNTLVAALVDVLGTHFGSTVPVAALSVMIIYYGLDTLCPNFESANE